MSNSLKNLEDTLRRGEESTSFSYGLRRWMSDHLRLIWNLVMMLILVIICIWASYVAGSVTQEGTIIESVVPEIREVKQENLEKKMENAIRSAR